MIKKIVIIAGDPNSINSEIIFKVWKKLNQSVRRRLYVIGNYNILKKQLRKNGYNIDLKKLTDIDDFSNAKKLNIIDINIIINSKNPFKIPKNVASKLVLRSLNLAHKLSFNKQIDGFINCPINKTLLPFQKGVTEYLASKNRIKKNSEVMLIRNKSLSVSPLTTHIDIKRVSSKISFNLIKNKIYTLNNWLKQSLKRNPKIALLGLNPHNAELKKKSEEIKIIKPAISSLKKNGINISGPFIADTIFIKDFKNYDVIVGIYHDQVLAPFKALFGFNAINITLGLQYLRISPDHGVAVDIIGKDLANPNSLLECIHFFNNFKDEIR